MPRPYEDESSCCCGPTRRERHEPSDMTESCARICTGLTLVFFWLMSFILTAIQVISFDIFFWIMVLTLPLGCCGIWKAGSHFRGKDSSTTIAYMALLVIIVIIMIYITGYAEVLFP